MKEVYRHTFTPSEMKAIAEYTHLWEVRNDLKLEGKIVGFEIDATKEGTTYKVVEYGEY